MITFCTARLPEEHKSATELITKVYADEGYVDRDRAQDLGITNYLGRKNTLTFLAHRGSLIGTISVVTDSEEGLPMHIIYKTELDTLREAGKQLAEVCQFAIDKQALKEVCAQSDAKFSELDVSVGLLGLVVHYGIHAGFHYLCFAVNPKHAAFYESLGCVRIGEEKSYPSVKQAPALPYILDLSFGATTHGEDAPAPQHFLIKKILQTPPPTGFFSES